MRMFKTKWWHWWALVVRLSSMTHMNASWTSIAYLSQNIETKGNFLFWKKVLLFYKHTHNIAYQTGNSFFFFEHFGSFNRKKYEIISAFQLKTKANGLNILKWLAREKKKYIGWMTNNFFFGIWFYTYKKNINWNRK